jgi:sigma-B regulation protein RsbU (phosphoserine phosphatase)
MNKTKEEFGEERLAQAVEKYAGGSASEIMAGIFKEVNTFAGNAEQHDDMTMIEYVIDDL